MSNSGSTSKPFDASAWIDGLKAHTEAGTVPPTVTSNKPESFFSKFTSDPSVTADTKVPFGKRFAQNSELLAKKWNALDGGGKVNVAMWGAGALLGAFGTINAARNSFSRDDEGKIHAQWSNVGIALLQATLTAGCAYASVHALHSAGR